MTEYAINKNRILKCASDYTEEEWNTLKSEYQISDFKMICCDSYAIPKTSQNFTQFFSHSDECTTAPETIWHKLVKSLVMKELMGLGIECIEEKNNKNWKADVYFKYNNRIIVIEIQHSQQTLGKYLKRQKRCHEDNIESYWVLYKPRYFTATKAIAKYKIRNEFEKKFLNQVFFHV